MSVQENNHWRKKHNFIWITQRPKNHQKIIFSNFSRISCEYWNCWRRIPNIFILLSSSLEKWTISTLFKQLHLLALIDYNVSWFVILHQRRFEVVSNSQLKEMKATHTNSKAFKRIAGVCRTKEPMNIKTMTGGLLFH